MRVGGRLVYATCSLLNQENRTVIDQFRASHPQFILKPVSEVLQEERISLAMDEYLELRPDRHGTDGFFAAVMERRD